MDNCAVRYLLTCLTGYVHKPQEEIMSLSFRHKEMKKKKIKGCSCCGDNEIQRLAGKFTLIVWINIQTKCMKAAIP